MFFIELSRTLLVLLANKLRTYAELKSCYYDIVQKLRTAGKVGSPGRLRDNFNM